MSVTTSIVFKDEKERDYIKRLIEVRRNLQSLVDNGALKALPDMIQLAMASLAVAQNQESTTITTMVTDESELPPFVEEVLAGGSYPNQEDCTHEEAIILYDKTFQSLFRAYMLTRDEKQRASVKQQLSEVVRDICKRIVG